MSGRTLMVSFISLICSSSGGVGVLGRRGELKHISCHSKEGPLQYCTTVRDELLVEFSVYEVEKMAEMEHDRWWDERVKRGWKPGPRSPGNRTGPYLNPCDQLDERTKGYDRDFIRSYPKILEMVDLSIRRNNHEPEELLQTPAVAWVCSSQQDA
jgi:hypothetical protein